MSLGDARRIGIFGGSFDPVHAGHLHAAREAARAFRLDHVVFVPAERSPHKRGVRPAGGADRMAMLRIATAELGNVSLSDIELRRGGLSYTIDTVLALPAELGAGPEVELFLILGSDNLPMLDSWHRVEELLRLVQPIVVHRTGDGPDPGPEDGAGDALPGPQELLAPLRETLPEDLLQRLENGLLLLSPVEASSTELRELLARGEDPGDLLPPGLLEYVRDRGIYHSG